MWREDRNKAIVDSYIEIHDQLVAAGYDVHEVPMERECRGIVSDARRGKNMFALGMLCNIYSFDMQLAAEQVALIFGKKDQHVVDMNVRCSKRAMHGPRRISTFKYRIPAVTPDRAADRRQRQYRAGAGHPRLGHGGLRHVPDHAGDLGRRIISATCSRRSAASCTRRRTRSPPARSRSARPMPNKCAVTITSGPGYSLKQEGIGLAVMGEIPLVVINVQRGGPSTGQPTKVEQGDLLTAMFGSHGDAPKVVMARGARSRTASIR